MKQRAVRGLLLDGACALTAVKTAADSVMVELVFISIIKTTAGVVV